MKILKSILRILPVIVFFSVSYAEDYPHVRHYLIQIEQRFEQASTRTQKSDIALQAVDLECLCNSGQANQPNSRAHKANPLSLAICFGNEQLVQRFLSVIPNINDLDEAAWGFRQPYMPTHMALDPAFPLVEKVPLTHRLAIIDALGAKGADFTLVDYKASNYTNPPLAAGDPSGRPLPERKQLMVRAMLYGADPLQTESSFSGVNLNLEPLINKYILQYFIERVKVGAEVRLAPAVTKALEKLLGEKGMSGSVLNYSTTRHHLQDSIAKLRLQKTKKAKHKARHLQSILEEAEEELKNFEGKLKNN